MSISRLIFTAFSDSMASGITTFEVKATLDGKELKHTSLPFKDSKLTNVSVNAFARGAYESILHQARLEVEEFEIFRHKDFNEDCAGLEIPAAIFALNQ